MFKERTRAHNVYLMYRAAKILGIIVAPGLDSVATLHRSTDIRTSESFNLVFNIHPASIDNYGHFNMPILGLGQGDKAKLSHVEDHFIDPLIPTQDECVLFEMEFGRPYPLAGVLPLCGIQPFSGSDNEMLNMCTRHNNNIKYKIMMSKYTDNPSICDEGDVVYPYTKQQREEDYGY